MKWFLLFTATALLFGCVEKKSDLDLFDEGRLRIDLSASPRRGVEPLMVNFQAYLETKERTVFKDIEEVKWVIDGPNDFYREIVDSQHNFQVPEDNVNDFFYLDFEFFAPGTYSVKLILNEGQYSSPAMKIVVMEDPALANQKRRRYN